MQAIIHDLNSHMTASPPQALNPRKTPRQARSTATMEAIHAATIQVLLSQDASQLTTTKVAERAGVSVGTMYQYFPNRQALLYAVVQQHLSDISDALDIAFERLRGKTLAAIADRLATDFLAATIPDIAASRAIYAAASQLDVPNIESEIETRAYTALRRLLASSSDGLFNDIDNVTFVLQQALTGTMRAMMEPDGSAIPSPLGVMRDQLPVLCRSYLLATAKLA